MLKKVVTYKNFNDEEVTETFFFNLSKAELIEMELGTEGGLGEHLKRIAATNDGAKIITEFKKILMAAYGVKSEDGKRFIKNDQLRDEFVSSEAYSELFMSLVTDADAAAAFVNGIVPQNFEADVAKLNAQAPIPAGVLSEPRLLTSDEVRGMDSDELRSGLAEGRYKIASQ